MSVYPRPPVVIPPTCVPGSRTRAVRPIRRAWIAAISPATVAPYTITSAVAGAGADPAVSAAIATAPSPSSRRRPIARTTAPPRPAKSILGERRRRQTCGDTRQPVTKPMISTVSALRARTARTYVDHPAGEQERRLLLLRLRLGPGEFVRVRAVLRPGRGQVGRRRRERQPAVPHHEGRATVRVSADRPDAPVRHYLVGPARCERRPMDPGADRPGLHLGGGRRDLVVAERDLHQHLVRRR